MTPDELASATRTDPRYAEAWLMNQAASGFISYDSGRYRLNEEQRAGFADETTPGFLPAGFDLALALGGAMEEVERVVRGADAAGPNARIVKAVDRLTMNNARARLSSWISGDTDMRLAAGGSLLEIGCGQGSVLLDLASRYPRARFTGIDPRVAPARSTESVAFIAANAATAEGSFDAVLAIDVVHELIDPTAVLRRIREVLVEKRGILIVVEPLAGDSDAENLNPGGRLLSSLAFLFCFPSAGAARIVGPLGGETRMRNLLRQAGFHSVTRIDDPHHLVLRANVA